MPAREAIEQPKQQQKNDRPAQDQFRRERHQIAAEVSLNLIDERRGGKHRSPLGLEEEGTSERFNMDFSISPCGFAKNCLYSYRGHAYGEIAKCVLSIFSTTFHCAWA